MTILSPFFCADLCRQTSEQACGTASIGDVWLLLEYPAAWERKAVEESELPPDVKAFLFNTIKTIPRARILLIKSDRVRRGDFTFYVVRSSERAPITIKFALDSYDKLTELDIATIAAGDAGSRGEIVSRPLYLICTHGRRDKCCAKFGYPLYKALSGLKEETVWQSSHVGGDRFAANLVCLPHGLFYAHVSEAGGRKIIGEYGAGRVVLDKYRGRTCYSHPVQAAEFFIRKETGIMGVDDLRHVGSERLDAKSWRVEFRHLLNGVLFEVEIRTRVSEFQNYITCDASEQKSVPEFVLYMFRASREIG